MADHGNTRGAASDERQGKGCLFWGCLGVSIVALLVMIIVGIVVFRVRQVAMHFTDTQPAKIPVVQVEDSEAKKAEGKFGELSAVLKDPQASGTFTFDAEEINTFIATIPDCKALRGKAQIRIEDNRLLADTSLPLDQIPGMKGRYLNGTIGLNVTCENGVLQVRATDVTVKGEPLPEELMSKLAGKNLAKDAYDNPKATDVIKRVDYITIEDGKLKVRLRSASEQ